MGVLEVQLENEEPLKDVFVVTGDFFFFKVKDRGGIDKRKH